MISTVQRRDVRLSSLSRPRTLGVLSLLLLSVLAAACGGNISGGGLPSPSPSTSAPATEEPGQAVLQTELANDIRALDQGVLTYSELGVLRTGEVARFSVSVTDIGKNPSKSMSASETSAVIGRGVDPNDVPTGAYVSVQVSCTNISCDSQPSSVPHLPVFVTGQSAWWYWQITAPSQPGHAQITISEYAYEGLSATAVLGQLNPPLTISLTVKPSKAYRPPSPKANLAGGASGPSTLELALIGGFFAIIAAIIGGAIPLLARRKKPKKPRGTAGH